MAGAWNGTTYFGDDTNETISAPGGNEVIFAGAGDDQAFGGAGNDVIDGGVGNDLLDGGSGNDILSDVQSVPFGFVGLIGHDDLRGGQGNDELRFYSIDTGDRADGGAGTDLLWLDTGVFSNTVMPAGTIIHFTMGPNGAASILQLNSIDTLATVNVERLVYFGVNAIDIITGGALNDAIYGGAENDHLFGGDGDDYLDGGTGVQDMDGGAGFDIASFDLSGSIDDIVLTNAADTITLGALGSIQNFEAFDNVTLGSGNNTVTLTQSQYFQLTAYGGNNTVTIGDGGSEISTGMGTDIFVTGAGSDQIDGGDGANSARMGAGDDEYSHEFSRNYLGRESVWGEDGHDTIATAAGNDRTYGGAGNDEIYTGQGNDLSQGGEGDDEIHGESGRDSLYGGAGNDRIDSDVDLYLGNEVRVENDLMDGGDGNDWLSGGVGGDQMLCGAGDDRATLNIITDANTIDSRIDTLQGGSGNDTLAMNGPGFSGTSDIEIILGPVTLVTADGVTIARGTGFEALDVRAYGGSHHFEGGDLNDGMITGQGNDTLVGFGGNDTLISTFGSDQIFGGGGNDSIVSVEVGGGDMVSGGAGNDLIYLAIPYLSETLEAGISTIDGGLGDDLLTLYSTNRDYTFDGSAIFVGATKVAEITGFERIMISGLATSALMNGFSGNDTLLGNGGDDTVNGLGGDDSLDGGIGNDILSGGVGNDILVSGTGLDQQFGGSGDDRFTLVADGQLDTIDGGLGTDVLSLNFGLTAPVIMSGSLASGATISTGGVTQANLSGIEVVSGWGTAGNDSLLGGSGDDTLFAQTGADTIATGAGNDSVTATLDLLSDVIDLGGGSGDFLGLGLIASGGVSLTLSANAQVFVGGVAVTQILGVEGLRVTTGAGNDSIIGGALSDGMTLNTGANFADGKGGDDAISNMMDLLADTLVGGGGNDLLSLYGGADAIIMDVSVPGQLTVTNGSIVTVTASEFEAYNAFGGSAGTDDTLRGQAGNDTLAGAGGNDLLSGGDGNDSLIGGDGLDVMTGGTGADVFAFIALSNAPLGSPQDRITDFVSGTDKLNLSVIDAKTTVFGNDTFTWIGTGAFSHVAGQAHYVVDLAANRVRVEVDVQGDGVADMVIRLDGLTALAETDLIL